MSTFTQRKGLCELGGVHCGVGEVQLIGGAASCSLLGELPRRHLYWAFVDRQGTVFPLLTPQSQSRCVLNAKHPERRAVMQGSVAAHKSQVQGLGSQEEQLTQVLGEPGDTPSWHSLSAGHGCDVHRTLQIGKSHMKVCHPCYCGDSWLRHPGCQTQGVCPEPG